MYFEVTLVFNSILIQLPFSNSIVKQQDFLLVFFIDAKYFSYFYFLYFICIKFGAPLRGVEAKRFSLKTFQDNFCSSRVWRIVTFILL